MSIMDTPDGGSANEFFARHPSNAAPTSTLEKALRAYLEQTVWESTKNFDELAHDIMIIVRQELGRAISRAALGKPEEL